MKVHAEETTSRRFAGMSAVCTFVALSTCMSAQNYVFSNASFPAGIRPIFVVADDFNGDGIQDLAVVNQCGSDPTCLTGGTISMLLGKPDGTFQDHIDYPVGIDPTLAEAGDFNNDGSPDIAVTNSSSNTVSILLGTGDGTFNAPVDYVTANGPVSAVIGDFNNDGQKDIVVANAGSQSVSVLLGNLNGTFQAHRDYSVNFSPRGVAAGDFNGDSKLDLVVADSDVSILLGNGDGTFQAPTEYPGNGATFVVIGDWNGDGKIDVAAASAFDDTVSVLKGGGDGTLQTPYVSYEVGGVPTSMVAVDLDGDGHADLAVGAGVGGSGPNKSGTMSVLLNKGDGTFQLHGNFGGMAAISLTAADFNGDGMPDVAAPNPDFNTVNVALGDGHGALGSVVDVLSPPDYPTQVLAEDFNHDSKLDLAMGLQGSGSVAVALGNGDGTFQSPIVTIGPGAAPRIAAGDFNGDGIPDLAVFILSVLNNVQILLGKGDGTFQAGSAFGVSNTPGQIVAADFNGDGKLDLATVGFGIVVLLGKGDGTFQPPIAFASRTSSAVLVLDFNKDGKLDLAILSPDFSTLTVFLGNGDGSFQSGVDYGAGGSPVGFTAADFNGDGSLDLATANAGSDTVSVLLGNGDGTFQSASDFPAVQGPRSVVAADFDGDGNIDLIVTGNGVAVLFGKGDGTFQPHQDYFAALDIAPAITADLDGDGQPDIVAANPFAASLSVFLNRSAIAVRPNHFSFPTLLVGSSSAPQTAAVYNPGIFPLRIQAVTTTTDFSQSNTCTPAVSGQGNCSIDVTYTPTRGGARSGAVTITDNGPGGRRSISLTGAATDFALAAATGANCPSLGNCSTSATISAGQSANYNLQVSPIGGFNGTVSLSCAAALSSMTCSVSPIAVPPTGLSSYAFTVTVAGSVNKALRAGPTTVTTVPNTATLAWAMFAPLFILVTIARTRRRRAIGVTCLLLGICLVSACGDHKGTPPPTHTTITVNGASGSVSRTLTLSLTISR